MFEKFLIKSMDKYKRIPNSQDNDPDYFKMPQDFKNRLELSLKNRLKIYEQFNITPLQQEYDFHYKSILHKQINCGDNYWDDINNLKNFFNRFAISLGNPNLMPKQNQLPTHLRSLISKYGTHSDVAKKVGLIYQGKLNSSSKTN